MINLPQYNDKALCDVLDKHLRDATILSVSPPTRPEHIFVLKVKYPNGEIQEIEVGATELGWWINEPFRGKHNFRKINLWGKEDHQCENCSHFPDEVDEEKCDGYYRILDDED